MNFMKKNILIICLSFIALLGLYLRISFPKDHIVWFYDQARDRKIVMNLIQKHDIVLRGPATSKWGLFHGPLYYYVIAPFYWLSNGEVSSIPLYALILMNVSTIIPISLIVYRITKSKKAVLISAFLFIISYEQIEYARWFTNVSLAIPLLTWYFYFSLASFEKKSSYLFSVLSGLFLGLSIQTEVFLLFYIPINVILYVYQKINVDLSQKIRKVLGFIIGLILGILPLILAEIKFDFLTLKTFTTQIGTSDVINLNLVSAISNYFHNVSLISQLTIFGLPNILSGCLILVILFIYFYNSRRNNDKSIKFFLLFLFFHFLLFFTNNVDRVYLNLGLDIIFIIITGMFIHRFIRSNMFILLILGSLTILQIHQRNTNIHAYTPFGKTVSDRPAYMLSSYLGAIDELYKMNPKNQFSVVGLANPYGVQTQWADLFDIYLSRNQGLIKPTWFGYYANGYLYDEYFQHLDYPQKNHYVLTYPQKAGFLPQPIMDDFNAIQDSGSTFEKSITSHDIIIQIRHRK